MTNVDAVDREADEMALAFSKVEDYGYVCVEVEAHEPFGCCVPVTRTEMMSETEEEKKLTRVGHHDLH